MRNLVGCVLHPAQIMGKSPLDVGKDSPHDGHFCGVLTIPAIEYNPPTWLAKGIFRTYGNGFVKFFESSN